MDKINSIDDLINVMQKNGSNGLTDFIRNSSNNSMGDEMGGKVDLEKNLLLIISYGILVIIAFFGNALVCHVIFSRRRMRTVTNIFIANLAVSDLLLVVLNVPFNLAKSLMNDWLFGDVMCIIMNMSLITSVYASTFTLTVIALDRQRVLLYPLRPRILKSGGLIVVAIIWFVSIVMSLPVGIYSKTQTVSFYVESAIRCRTVYPSPKFEQYLTVVTLILQYILPLAIIGVTYGRIVRRIWERTDLGAMTANQHACRSKHKKKSIKMLMIVVIVFALCWMPLNLYHLLTDLHPDSETFPYNSTAFFVCHLVAISSTCYNPFIYCWLNEAFRAEIRAVFRCCMPSGMSIHPRDLHARDSVSQSEILSLHVNPKSIFFRRGKTTLESLHNASVEDTPALKQLVRQKSQTTCGCDSVCICMTPDSWKSVSGIMAEECNNLLSKEIDADSQDQMVKNEEE